MGILFCGLVPIGVVADDEDKVKDPSSENDTPEIHSKARVK